MIKKDKEYIVKMATFTILWQQFSYIKGAFSSHLLCERSIKHLTCTSHVQKMLTKWYKYCYMNKTLSHSGIVTPEKRYLLAKSSWISLFMNVHLILHLGSWSIKYLFNLITCQNCKQQVDSLSMHIWYTSTTRFSLINHITIRQFSVEKWVWRHN